MGGVTSRRFSGLTQEWAIAVAQQLDGFAGDHEPSLDDLWISGDLSLNVRYRIGRSLLALRVERLDVDPTSAGEPDDAAGLASNLLHSLHAPGEPEWVDSDGYVWWGDPPADGWPTVSSRNALAVLR